MKKLLVTALFGAFAVAQETTPVAAPTSTDTKHELLYVLDGTYRLDGDQLEGEHFVRYTYTYAGGYKLKPGLSYFTNRTNTGGEWNETVEHAFLRLEFDTPKFWDIAGFKTNVRLRYNLPTSGSAQEAGSYGTLSNRLIMEKEFSSFFNLTVIPKINVVFNRNGHQVRGAGEGNQLVGAALEVLPQIKFSENLTLTYDADVTVYYTAEAVDGTKEAFYDAKLNHELELMYNISSLSDLGVGAIVTNDDVSFRKKLELFEAKATFVGVRIQKNFDL